MIDKYEAWTISLTDENDEILSQDQYECEKMALLAYSEMCECFPNNGVVLTHHTDWEMTDDGEYLPKSFATIHNKEMQ
jgi:hypothetical protein